MNFGLRKFKRMNEPPHPCLRSTCMRYFLVCIHQLAEEAYRLGIVLLHRLPPRYEVILGPTRTSSSSSSGGGGGGGVCLKHDRVCGKEKGQETAERIITFCIACLRHDTRIAINLQFVAPKLGGNLILSTLSQPASS